jgi:ABC-type antimicrobial peptide transport system permease subunit
MMFVPYHRDARPVMALFARVTSDTDAMIQAIQRAVWSLDPTRPVFDIRRVDRLVTDSLAVRTLAARVSAAAAVVTLLLALGGIYATLSHVVSERRREIGVRVALGARGRDVAAFVLRRGVTPSVAGVGCGLITASWLSSLARQQLFGISPLDPFTYALGAVLLLGITCAASAVPARRATRVDPVGALKVIP